MRMIRALTLLGLLILTGCVTVSRPTSQQQAQASHAVALEHQGQYAQAAHTYTQLAAQDPAARSYFLLRAAEDWRQQGNLDQSAQALNDVRRKTLSSLDRHRYDLLQAQFALKRGDIARTLALTPTPVSTLPEELQQRTLELRAQALAASGNAYQAARVRLHMDLQLQGLDRAQNERKIVQLLGQLGPAELKQRRQSMAINNPMQPWIDHALDQLGVPGAPNANQPVGTLMPGQTQRQGYRNPGRIALLLPLSGSLAHAGRLIREGFFTAYFNDDAGGAHRPEVKVYNSGGTPQQSLAAYQQAVQDGARQVIGPLTRQDVAAVINQASLPVPVLALNHTGIDIVPPPNVNEFALLPEAEGASAARRMLEQGLTRAYTVVSSEAFAQRAGKAFAQQFTAQGGKIVGRLTLDPTVVNYSKSIRTISPPPTPRSTSRHTANVYNKRIANMERNSGIFISMRPPQARLLLPQLRLAQFRQPVFASSHVYDGYDNPNADRDLDGITFCDAPWLFDVQPGLPSRSAIAKRLPMTSGAGARLFAFGMDAWSLTPYLSWLRTRPGSYVPGATGQLVEDDFGRIQRSPIWARFKNGIAHPLSGSLDMDKPTDQVMTPVTNSVPTPATP